MSQRLHWIQNQNRRFMNNLMNYQKISWLFLFHIEWHRQGFVITLLFLRMEALKKWVVIMN